MAHGWMNAITWKRLQQLNSEPFIAVGWRNWEIDGLTLERALVFPSGLAILIAIFTELNIQCMTGGR